MSDSSSDAMRRLIRMANDESLDRQSRETICAIARQVRNLHNVSQKINDLDMKLQAFGRTNGLSD